MLFFRAQSTNLGENIMMGGVGYQFEVWYTITRCDTEENLEIVVDKDRRTSEIKISHKGRNKDY